MPAEDHLQERPRPADDDVTYRDFDESPQVSDETFAAKIPDGYQRIKIMRHATVNDPKRGSGAVQRRDPGKKPG